MHFFKPSSPRTTANISSSIDNEIDKSLANCLIITPTSRWIKNDFELVRWPPDVEKDKAAGINVAGEEQEDDTPDAAQVSLRSGERRQGTLLALTAFCPGVSMVLWENTHVLQSNLNRPYIRMQINLPPPV